MTCDVLMGLETIFNHGFLILLWSLFKKFSSLLACLPKLKLFFFCDQVIVYVDCFVKSIGFQNCTHEIRTHGTLIVFCNYQCINSHENLILTHLRFETKTNLLLAIFFLAESQLIHFHFSVHKAFFYWRGNIKVLNFVVGNVSV